MFTSSARYDKYGPKWILKDGKVYLFPNICFDLKQLKNISLILQIIGAVSTLVFGYMYSEIQNILLFLAIIICFSFYLLGVKLSSIKKDAETEMIEPSRKTVNYAYNPNEQSWHFEGDKVSFGKKKTYSIVTIYSLSIILKMIAILVFIVAIFAYAFGQFILSIVGIAIGGFSLIMGIRTGKVAKLAKGQALNKLEKNH